MEWGVGAQLPLLCQCAPIGACIGFFFDCMSGWLRHCSYRRRLFVADALFGGFAALVTFFGALVVLDGQMHPMLFFGVLIGFLVEHWVVGKWIGRLLCRTHVFVSRFVRDFIHCMDSKLVGFCRYLQRIVRKTQKMRKNQDKI